MRTSVFISRVAAVAIVMLATYSASATPIDLSGLGYDLFNDHFTGTSLNSQWTAGTLNSGATVLVNSGDFPGTSVVEIYSANANNRQAHITTTSPLNLAASPTDWWLQVVFRFPVISSGWNTINSGGTPSQYHILTGQKVGTPSAPGLTQGFDLAALRYGSNLWGLAWYGTDDDYRIAEILDDNAGTGYAFSNTANYVVSLHRKSDNNVDIYFDNSSGDGSVSNLIATKGLILGDNPNGMYSGEWSSVAAGYVVIDKISIQSVPEPSSILLAIVGLLPGFGAAVRRRHPTL